MTQPSVLAILGPTASGKTQLALDLAQALPIEIISLDSALIYRDMNIGTAKPTAAEMALVPHHLIDIISPLDSYSAADFCRDALALIQEITDRGKLPVIVGGTMMYYKALTEGLNDLPAANATIRASLQADKAALGLAALYERLLTVDPDTAARLKAGDSQRIERALEIFMLTGKPMSQHFKEQAAHKPALNLTTLALIPETRSLLHAQIKQRFDSMMAQGFIDEVRALQTQYPGLHADLPSIRCVGYRQAWAYLAGEEDLASMTEKSIVATRQLAKRQLTWLRSLDYELALDPYVETDLLTPTLALLARKNLA
ncbi:MAG: tRNA (adenosine(37)-N6)-dimethylallyltransferase MiaA [Neisseriaceae bacterium]|nr:tRNA (adenosine(37)-N6)-dimethylallyltransferase MiaA [Neisseriaceae bacterium]